MTFVNDFQKADGGLIERIATALRTMKANRAERAEKSRVYHDTLNQLNGLSNRDLNDIGISRSMIQSIAFEAAFGK